jgi:hypothetical protein
VKGCGKAIRGKTFQERMAKLRKHRKKEHPTEHARSIKKAFYQKTKGYDRGLKRITMERKRKKQWERAHRKHDPLKVRKGLTNKPRVTDYLDIKGKGMIRVLRLAIGKNFPEFALYMEKRKPLIAGLSHAGLKEESKGKWVLRTNKFNIFVYM